jgi:SpoVK/Ycf46/Vps4 family AAA+-type ATPase
MPAVDPISSKGEDCIFLCYGPPGTGKTLTAEAIAEKLHRTLWTINASVLSFQVDIMEEKLFKILDIAYCWRAVLLLNEADIYLENRTSGADPTRNAMTGIFLRLLEYYKGVLFLTTNRVTAVDAAFCPRISMFIRYHPLTHSSRAKVWETLLCRAELRDVNLEMFAAHELKGRDFRNCIRIAHTWATSCKEPLTTQRVLEGGEHAPGIPQRSKGRRIHGISRTRSSVLFLGFGHIPAATATACAGSQQHQRQ